MERAMWSRSGTGSDRGARSVTRPMAEPPATAAPPAAPRPRRTRPPLPAAEIGVHHSRRVVTGRTHHAAPGMRSGAAQVQAAERRSIAAGLGDRAHREQLVERHLTVEDVAADQSEPFLEILRREDLP